MRNINYRLLDAVYKEYNFEGASGDLGEVFVDLMEAVKERNYLEELNNELEQKIRILEAENKLLKKHPVECEDPECGNGWGCMCYTR